MNRIYSTEKLQKFQREGQYVFVRLDEKKETSELEQAGEVEQYSYLQSKIKLSGNIKRDMIIESIVRAKYPTYGAEIAAMANSGEEYQEHQDWRQLAKDTADYFIDNFFNISNNI